MAATNKDKMVEGMREYIRNPAKFVYQVFGATPETWQAEALQALANKSRVAVRSGHGVGKTTFEAWSALWFIFTRPFPKIPCTAPTQKQLNDVLMAEINKWMDRAPVLKETFESHKTRIAHARYPERWFITPRTSNKPENLAGFHEDHLLFIVDEASGIKDNIFETIEGALTTSDVKLLICGNPTKTSGAFHDAFYKDRALFHTMTVSCLDIQRDRDSMLAYAERIAKKYGEHSDVYRVRVLGVEPKAEPDVFIPMEIAAQAVHVEQEPVGPLVLGVDPARYGDDEAVIYPRIGTHVFPCEVFRNIGTDVLAGHAVRIAKDLMRQYHLSTVQINVDDDGLGGGTTDTLYTTTREWKGWTIVPCHFGGAGNEEYDNEASIMMGALRDLLMAEEIDMPDDEDTQETIAQLATRKYTVTPAGKIQIESKKIYKKRMGFSPDRGDALMLCFRPTINIKQTLQTVKSTSPLAGIRKKRF